MEESYIMNDLANVTFPDKEAVYALKVTSSILKEICEIAEIDLEKYRAPNARNYKFSRPAIEMWSFLIKFYKSYKDYSSRYATKNERKKLKEFVDEFYKQHEKIYKYLSSTVLTDQKEELIRQEFHKLSSSDFDNIYNLFMGIYYAPSEFQYEILARIKMKTMISINQEMEFTLKQIFNQTDEKNFTLRVEMYLKEMERVVIIHSSKMLELIKELWVFKPIALLF